MKRLYTTPEYKIWHNRRLNLLSNKSYSQSNKRKQKSKLGKKKKKSKSYSRIKIKETIFAPADLRLIEETESCLLFFRKLRSDEYLSKSNRARFVVMSLKFVTQIDYGAISILTAISDDLKSKNILLKGDFPENPDCKQFIIDSGFLDHMYDDQTGKPFPKSSQSDMIFFEKGTGILSIQDNMRISQTVKRVVRHLTGELKQCFAVKSIILEICGNSIEWGGTDNKLWLLGVKYEQDAVMFTVTDVGKGILETLHRKFGVLLVDIFTMKSDHEILAGAFEQKYGSSSQEVNRNKGLPAVRHNFNQEIILNLKVLTNNVILHFDDIKKSKTFEKGSPRFRGTFYEWVMKKDCIRKLTNE